MTTLPVPASFSARYLVMDCDDTFTVAGSLSPPVLQAISHAAAEGLEIILNTGRPAGYGATLLGYVEGFTAAVMENGGAFIDALVPSPAGTVQTVPAHHRHELPLQLLCSPSGTDSPAELRRRLTQLQERVAQKLGLKLTPTADNAYRVTDFTVLRTLTAPGASAAQSASAPLLDAIKEAIQAESAGQGSLLASSIHLHFMLDGGAPRGKWQGVVELLRRRGISNPESVLATSAVSVGDSANDASLFVPGRFALSVGVANIARYLPELGPARPRHITHAPEGHGLVELLDALLKYHRPTT